jgi:ADP-ribose pyrophosphatase YjhB (NUDIX family)
VNELHPRLIPMPRGVRLRITIEPGEPPPPTPEVVQRWEALGANNPRLYNGPVLSVRHIDSRRGIIRCRRDTYQRLIVQPQVQTGVQQLSVTGVLIARDQAGRPAVLLGQRSGETRMYAGLWELGPAGGIEPPRGTQLDHEALVAQLHREIQEETSLHTAGDAEALAIVCDPLARSHDIALRMDLGSAPPLTQRGWEYQNVRWVRLDELPSLLREQSQEIIPPSRMLLRLLSETAQARGLHSQ